MLTIHTDRHPLLADTAESATERTTYGPAVTVRPVTDWSPVDGFTTAYLRQHGFGALAHELDAPRVTTNRTELDYVPDWQATRRVAHADGYTLSDLDHAARFTSANEYVRQSETMVAFDSPDFSQGGGALLVNASRVDTDAGQRGSVGTCDGRVVHTSDTRVTRTVDCILFVLTVEYVVPGGIARKGRNSAANGHKGGRKPKGATATPASIARAERRRRQRERERTSTLAIADARVRLPNLSRETVEA